MKYYLPPLLALLLAVFGITRALEESRKPEAPHVYTDLVSGREVGAEAPPPGGWRQNMHVFLYGVLGAAAGGIFLIRYAVPRVSELVGDYFYSPGQYGHMGPFEKAMELKTSGELEKAEKAFQRIIDKGTPDHRAYVELARIQEKENDDIPAALATLERGAAAEWPMEEHCKLLLRLADVAGGAQEFARARQPLERLMARYPGTPQAGAAAMKLNQLEDDAIIARTRAGR